jgi:hypothetical protein
MTPNPSHPATFMNRHSFKLFRKFRELKGFTREGMFRRNGRNIPALFRRYSGVISALFRRRSGGVPAAFRR